MRLSKIFPSREAVKVARTRQETTLTPWATLAGMRVSGEPVGFEAGLRIIHPDWTGFSSAVKYLQRPRYSRTGTQGIVESDCF